MCDTVVRVLPGRVLFAASLRLEALGRAALLGGAETEQSGAVDLSPSPPRGRGSGRGFARYFSQPCERSLAFARSMSVHVVALSSSTGATITAPNQLASTTADFSNAPPNDSPSGAVSDSAESDETHPSDHTTAATDQLAMAVTTMARFMAAPASPGPTRAPA